MGLYKHPVRFYARLMVMEKKMTACAPGPGGSTCIVGRVGLHWG